MYVYLSHITIKMEDAILKGIQSYDQTKEMSLKDI